jgi:hypothetical protein
MNAGTLRHKVDIRPAVRVNTDGAETLTYPTTASRGVRNMSFRAIGAREATLADRLQADVQYVFEARYDTATKAIRADDRLLIGSTSGPDHHWYEVGAAFDPFGRRAMVRILAGERQV